MTEQERLAKGAEIRRQVLGASHADKAAADPTKFQKAFRDFTIEHCWGNVWVREGLSHKTRSILNLGMLAAMARWHEFEIHVRGALNNGVTEEELIEISLQAGVYCGVPITVETMRIIEHVVNDWNASKSKN